MLELRNIWKSFGHKTVLQGVSLKARRGSTFCIIGPNGAGKTTILRMIDLLEKPDRGEIIYDNVNILALDSDEEIACRRKMAVVFQQPVLYKMSVYDNVSIGLKIRGMEKRFMKERVQSALEAVNLYDYRDSQAHTLSGGEAQRLCLARALVLEPEILLLDEPTANLDPANTIVVENIVREYGRNGKGVVIFTTHNMFEAKRLADRILLLVDGRIVEEGDAAEFFASPHDDRAAKFVRGEIILG